MLGPQSNRQELAKTEDPIWLRLAVLAFAAIVVLGALTIFVLLLFLGFLAMGHAVVLPWTYQ